MKRNTSAVFQKLKPELKNRSAFTFVEIMITVLLIAIFSGGFVIAFNNSRNKATFDANVNSAIAIIQKARNLSLTNLQTNDLETEYYRLSVASSGLTLTGYDESGGTASIESLTFDTGITANSSFYVDYTPPYGEVTLSTGGTSSSFTMSDGVNSSTIEISIYGGFPEVSF